jgi:tetratricopeptide (TPR) repeat protein
MPWAKQTHTFCTKIVSDLSTIAEMTWSDDPGLLNNHALQLSNKGHLADAENLHLRALSIKEQFDGPNSFSTSITRNALGELYLKLGQPNEAEENFRKAVAIRDAAGAQYAFDAAVSRENLAQVYEMKGDSKRAEEIRISAGKLNMVCANRTVGIFDNI